MAVWGLFVLVTVLLHIQFILPILHFCMLMCLYTHIVCTSESVNLINHQIFLQWFFNCSHVLQYITEWVNDKSETMRKKLWSIVSLLQHLHVYLLTPCSRVLLEKLTGFAANQEIPRILWNLKVNYGTHKRTPPVPILSQLHPVPTTSSCIEWLLWTLAG